jgi:hypothetical protein
MQVISTDYFTGQKYDYKLLAVFSTIALSWGMGKIVKIA